MASIPVVTLPSGEQLPALGQGAFGIAHDHWKRDQEIAALRAGIDLGLSVIDTAEVYADGESERLVADAVGTRRDDVFVVSKVLPAHATSRHDLMAACEGSLERLGTDRLDLYLLHWPRDNEPLAAETFATFEELAAAGKIRYWGVSNFALCDMETLDGLGFGHAVVCNQILYNLRRRGVERDLLPWCRDRGVMVMAYSPIEQGAMAADPLLAKVAARHGATAAQAALSWLLTRQAMAIPKAGSVAHVQENRDAVDLELTVDDLQDIETAFAPPAGPVPFDML